VVGAVEEFTLILPVAGQIAEPNEPAVEVVVEAVRVTTQQAVVVQEDIREMVVMHRERIPRQKVE
jgi:hypothetical protein